MAGYVFRDDLEADKNRAHDAGMAAATTQTPQQAPALPGPPAPKPQSLPPAQENPFEAFGKALEAQNPMKQAVNQNIQTQLDNPYQGADAANAAARDRLARESNAAQEEARSAAVTAYGGYGTGQAPRALDQFRSNRLMNQQSFELDAAANRAQSGEQVRSNAVSQGQGMIGLGQQEATTGASFLDSAANRASQERVAFAGIAQQDRALAQQASQFGTELEFRQSEAVAGRTEAEIQRAWQSAQQEKAIASEEKVAFAGLNIQEKQIAQQALQFDTELEFRQSEAVAGRTEAEIQRAWEAAQNDKQMALQEKLTNSEIGSRERMQALDQVFQGAEANKNRTLETMLQGDRIKAQFALSELENTFQEKLQATGYLQTKDLQILKQDFEKQLQESGISADMARQLSDQQFQSIEADRDRVFNATQTQIQQSWATGERLSAQDWQTSVNALDMKHDDLMQEREFAVQQRMQTEQIDAELKRVGLQIASQELMSAAQLAQQDGQFREEIMLKRDISSQEIDIAKQRLGAELESLGLQAESLQATLQNDKVRNAMEIAAFGMELGNGSREAMAPFVEQLGVALESAFKEQGVDITSEALRNALTPSSGGGTPLSIEDVAKTGTTKAAVEGAMQSANTNQVTINGSNFTMAGLFSPEGSKNPWYKVTDKDGNNYIYKASDGTFIRYNKDWTKEL